MGKKIGNQTFVFTTKPRVISSYAIAGKKEGQGNFKEYFDYILQHDMFGEKTFEHAERKMLEHAIVSSIDKAHLKISDIDLMLSGDLLNQIISATFSARKLNIPFVGIYGACSTMAESLGLGAVIIDGKFASNVICATSSHFSSAERQYRFPLELGNQRTPTSQWTVTGAGSSVVSNKGSGVLINSVTFGKVTDFGIKDVNNMGAAMAPAAMTSLITHFEDTKTTPQDYDYIFTGDLGKLGSDILVDLMENKGYHLGNNYCDCGQMMFTNDQKTFQGASGAGCSAIVLNSFIYDKIKLDKLKKVLFCATGALLSATSSQQGDSIPGICHVVELGKYIEEN